MKRRNMAARLICAGVVLMAMGVAFSGAAARAQAMHRVTTAEIAQTEAAKKEVEAYKAVFAKMEQEKGWAAASRFFLTPLYKETDVAGRTRTREEHIRFWASVYDRIKSEQAQMEAEVRTAPGSQSSDEKITPSRNEINETYAARNSTVFETVYVVVPAVAPPPAPPLVASPTDLLLGISAPAFQNPHRPAQTMHIVERVYQRTPNGLRLQQETVRASKFGINDHVAIVNGVAPQP